jgi:YVTN family beta-propeller protein
VSVSDLSVGSELLGYRVEGVLGRGGMSIVYLAEDLRLKRRVALKLLAPALAEDEAFRERFLVESELAASLDHPNIVPIFAAGDADGRLFIAMRYVEGSDLKELLRRGRLTPERTLAVCGQVAAALDFAHERGLAHRDVKPSNVLLDSREHAYLADFGLTRRHADQDASTAVARSLGTIDYVSPEQIRGGEVDGRADVYSLGCVLYECLAGKPPFRRSTDAAALFAHLEEEPPAPPGLDRVIRRALAKQPSERYGTCTELIEDARVALGLREPPRPSWWRAPVTLAVIGAALIAVALAAYLAASGGGAASPSTAASLVRVAPNSVAVIDTANDRVVGAVPVGAGPGAIAFGSGSLWVANQDDQNVWRIDPKSLRELGTFPLPGPPIGIAASRDGIWVTQSDLNPAAGSVAVSRIDPEFDSLGPTVSVPSLVPGGPGGVAAQGNSVWVSPSAGLLTRLDARTGRVMQHFDPNATPGDIAIGYGAIWTTDTVADDVIRVDRNGDVTPIPVGNGPGAIAVGAGGVWVADSSDDAVKRINPSSGAVLTTIAVGHSPAGIAIGAGSVWVANAGDGTVTRIDPRTDTVATIAVGGSPRTVTIAAGRAWVTVDARSGPPPGLAAGGGTLRIETSGDVTSMDPAIANDSLSGALLWASCAQLVTYPDESGPAGSLPIPDVAQSLPTRSADGKTYTFRIRQGFRFSPPSNQPVTAQTFKYSIERTLNPAMHSSVGQSLADIVGAGAYMAGKANRISGIVANGDTLAIRLVAPAPNFLFRLAFPWFCAVPSNTPVEPGGVGVIPSAGPYYVSSYVPGQGVVLLRNPNYHGPRPRHFERIELAVGIPEQQAVADVEAGRADYTNLGLWWPGPASPRALTPLVAKLAARYGSQSRGTAGEEPRYFVNPVLATYFILLNTRRPLFSDVRARLAANYAIDRRRLAALGGYDQAGPLRLTDHYLPPGIAGFRDAHLYPPTSDVAKARRLMQARRRTAVLYTCNISPCPEQAQIVKTDLAAIGLQVQIKSFPLQILYRRVATPGARFDLFMDSYIADYPDPQGILNPVLADSSLAPTLNDVTYLRRLAAAARLSGPERYLTYGELDLDLARNAAPLIAYGDQTTSDFFAARVGCQTYSYVWGMDLGALCIKLSSR